MDNNDKKTGIVNAEGMKNWYMPTQKGEAKGVWVMHNATCHHKEKDIQASIDSDKLCHAFRVAVDKAISDFQAGILAEKKAEVKATPDFGKMTTSEFAAWKKANQKA